MSKKRAKQPAIPLPSTTSSTTSATAPDPSLRGSSRKRTASAAALTTSPPSANAKRSKPSPSPSASFLAMKSERDEALEDLDEARETSTLLQLALDEKMTTIDGLKARIKELEGGA